VKIRPREIAHSSTAPAAKAIQRNPMRCRSAGAPLLPALITTAACCAAVR
jgi:hypothetical protein